MIYKNFQNHKLSALGLGAMRLPVIGGDDSKIDETAAEKMVDYAMEHGINYYDTAWGYHGGIPGKATIWRLSFLAMIFLIWIK